MRRLLLGALVALPLALSGVPGESAPTASAAGPRAAAAPAVESACPDAVLVAVPGGGQGGVTDPGPTLAGLAQRIVARAAASSRTVTTRVVSAETAGPWTLRGRGGPRTAAEKAVTRAAWRRWWEPVSELVPRLEQEVADATAGCPDQLVYLVGQSQGAEAVHRYLANRAPADLRTRTVAVVLVGDPARVAGSGGPIHGDPAAPRGARGVSDRFSRYPAAAVPTPGWLAPIHSVCTAGDIVCDLGPTRFRRAQRIHRSYDDAPMQDRLARRGRWLGSRLTLWPDPAQDQQVSGHVGMLLSRKLQVSVASRVRDDLRFSAVSGLPPGLRVTRRGTLRGTPERAGTWALDYTVRNTSSEAVSRPMSGQVSVTIQPPVRAEVSGGGRHTCEVRADGTLWCWGANFYGQLGVGDTRTGATPRQVGTARDWESVSTGGMHTCGVRENGTLWCWGLNYRGQLGIGNRKDQVRPRRVGDARTWAAVDAGWVHSCATRRDGVAWCWGENGFGQLGHGNRRDYGRPVRVRGGHVWEDVSAGGWHTCGVTKGGDGYCWGRNSSGQVGDGSYVMRINPQRVGAAGGWVAVEPAWTHTCGLGPRGQISCWGGNEGGQLGGGRFRGTNTPRVLDVDRPWTSVHTGVNFSCALDTERALWCWGTGRSGQLDGPQRSAQPVRVRQGTAWAQVDLGWLFGCGLTSAGTGPACWGNDETGELGRTGGEAPRTTTTTARAGGFAFNLVSFNVLGSNHTSPRRDAADFTPARIRSEWAMDYLRSINASIVGFQEIQRDQVGWFQRGAGSTYDLWPGTELGGDGLQTSIAWKHRVWRFEQGDTVTIPFLNQERQMPLVRLEHRATGRSIWVMNVHNAPQGNQEEREIAVRREIRRLKQVTGQGVPVFLVGDFNERDRAFCEVTGKLDFVAPRGGSFSGGTCHPPDGFVRVDWIFGSKDADYSRYREDKSALVRLMTDHAVLRTRVTVP